MRRTRRTGRRTVPAAAVALASVAIVALPAPSAHAQRAVTVGDLALQWSQGRFASPLICQIDGEPVRGLRRVFIEPGPRRAQRPVNRVKFIDMEVEDAERCFADLEGDLPNVEGEVQIRLRGNHKIESAQRDFREALRRKHGFEFDVTDGRLKIQPVTNPPTPARIVDFSGGRLELLEVRPGTDQARVLAPFPSPRKLSFELTSKDGTRLAFPLYLSEPERRPRGTRATGSGARTDHR